MSEREQKIRDFAYALWESEGRPEGRHSEHWHQAMRELDKADRTLSVSDAPTAVEPGSALRSRRGPRQPVVPAVQDPSPKRPVRRPPRAKPAP